MGGGRRGRANFKVKKIIRGKEGIHIMIKGSILQEHNIILNVYEPNNRVTNNTKQKLIELQGEIAGPTIVVGDFNTLFQQLKDLEGRKSLRMQLKSTLP